ncbi:MAG TPA: HEAT repeat domain-containing protein [Candidatus Norongarragalinales archaeon]|jgi:hypothetical protein|nr:HEAT repeat domain-containing protein [Candidatus Norongarragalinales archaeon]
MSKLEKFLKHGNVKLVMRHLLKLKKPELVAMALEHESAWTRIRAKKLIARMGTKGEALALKLLHSKNPLVVAGAIDTLSIYPRPKNALQIAEVGLRHPEVWVRSAAVLALPQFGNPKVLPLWHEAMQKEPNGRLRKEMQDFEKALRFGPEMIGARTRAAFRTPRRVFHKIFEPEPKD